MIYYINYTEVDLWYRKGRKVAAIVLTNRNRTGKLHIQISQPKFDEDLYCMMNDIVNGIDRLPIWLSSLGYGSNFLMW